MNSRSRVWQRQFAFVRSKFEEAASRHFGTKCSLLREPVTPGTEPIGQTFERTRDAARALGQRVGPLARGVVKLNSFKIEGRSYIWWLFHPGIVNIRLTAQERSGAVASSCLELRSSMECEGAFCDLIQESGGLLDSCSAEHGGAVVEEPASERLRRYSALWIFELFRGARVSELGSLLSSPRPRSTERQREASEFLADVMRKHRFDENTNVLVELFPPSDDCVSTLDFSPFSASVALIDSILDGGSKDANPQYTPTDLRRELKVSDSTLNFYAKNAGVATPGQGKRNYKYSASDRDRIIAYAIANAPPSIAEHARHLADQTQN